VQGSLDSSNNKALLPKGNWNDKAQNIEYQNGILKAELENYDGDWQES
jgi:hypothetical protein